MILETLVNLGNLLKNIMLFKTYNNRFYKHASRFINKHTKISLNQGYLCIINILVIKDLYKLIVIKGIYD